MSTPERAEPPLGASIRKFDEPRELANSATLTPALLADKSEAWPVWMSVAGGVDFACTLSLLGIGASHGAANLAGAVVGYLTLLAIQATSIARSGRHTEPSMAVAFFALALRGGVIGSAIALGTPAWFSVLVGVLAGWMSIYFGHTRRDTWWSSSAHAILVIAVLLRVVYLDVLPLLPEETYYWNYAAHIDVGYLDHPPLVAWLIAVGELVLGRTEAGLRFGSLVCGLATLWFVHRLARRLVDQTSALAATALAVALPFLFGTSVMMTPDAPLIALWSAALYFFHGAFVIGSRAAWLGAGVAMGLGLLSKYSIALLGLAALSFIVLDQRSRRWLTRWEPYAAAAIALALCAPVIVWNFEHEWASFVFQGWGRFGDESSFSLHVLLMNVLVVATPLPLLALPLLFAKRWTRESHATCEPEHAAPRNRLFVACFVFAPLLVFFWSALEHAPRLNWTAPIWLATLPLLGWTITHADTLRTSRWSTAMFRLARRGSAALLMLTAALLYYIALGIPGVPYPKSFARAMGWATATQHLEEVHDQLTQTTGSAPIVIGMDKYFTAAQVSYHATKLFSDRESHRSANQTPMKVTAKGVVFGGDGLMFEYWDTPQQFAGRTFIMVARRKAALESEGLAAFFRTLDTKIHSLPLIHDGPAGNGNLIDLYYYRIGYGYRPE